MIDKEITVVPFDRKYAEDIVRIARTIHARSIYWDVDFDAEKLLGQFEIAGTKKSPDRWFRLAIFREHAIGGFYGCQLRTFFGNALLVKDMGWWVAPTERGRGAAQALLSAFEDWGREIGAAKSIIGYNGIEDIEEKRRVFEWQGYTVTGYNTEKEL